MSLPMQTAPVTPTAGGGGYVNMTADTLCKTGDGHLLGIFVASASSSPTIKVWDSTAASGAVLVNTFTPIAGTWYPLPFHFQVGLFVDIGGTVDITVSFH